MTDERFNEIVWNTIFYKEMRGCDDIAWERLREVVDMACKDEREACAQICEDHFASDGAWCAEQIRGMK